MCNPYNGPNRESDYSPPDSLSEVRPWMLDDTLRMEEWFRQRRPSQAPKGLLEKRPKRASFIPDPTDINGEK